MVLDLDKIADGLPENRPGWAYNEERQQNTYVCKVAKCDTRYDVLGRYAGCPNCGYRNSLQVLDGDLTAVAEKLKLAGSEANAVVESDLLGRCFSDFEAMAKDVQGQLAILPATPRRRKQVEAISFQRMAEAQQNRQAARSSSFELLGHFRFCASRMMTTGGFLVRSSAMSRPMAVLACCMPAFPHRR